MSKTVDIAMIGLDTSHTLAFTKRFHGVDGAPRTRGLRIRRVMRFPSPFQSEAQQDQRQKTLESWGIEVTRDFRHAVDGVQGIMLEINDPAQHWTYFKKAAALKLPMFIDKPLAKNLSDAKKIIALSKERRLKVWEASALRFSPDLHQAMKQAGPAELVNIYGAMGVAPTGSSLIWYGCHTFQMMNQIMGNKAQRVHAVADARGVTTTVEYADGRRGVIESITGCGEYGGRIHGTKGIVHFRHSTDVYASLMPAIRNFFTKGIIPVPLNNSYATQAMLDAAEKSLHRGKAVRLTGNL